MVDEEQRVGGKDLGTTSLLQVYSRAISYSPSHGYRPVMEQQWCLDEWKGREGFRTVTAPIVEETGLPCTAEEIRWNFVVTRQQLLTGRTLSNFSSTDRHVQFMSGSTSPGGLD